MYHPMQKYLTWVSKCTRSAPALSRRCSNHCRRNDRHHHNVVHAAAPFCASFFQHHHHCAVHDDIEMQDISVRAEMKIPSASVETPTSTPLTRSAGEYEKLFEVRVEWEVGVRGKWKVGGGRWEVGDVK